MGILRKSTVGLHYPFLWVLPQSGPARDLERLMVDGGFNETDTPFGFIRGSAGEPIYHPFSVTGFNSENGLPWMVNAYYAFKPPFAIGLVASDTKLGTTWGFHDPIVLGIDYKVAIIASTMAIQLWHVLRLGVGPAIFYPEASSTNTFRAEASDRMNSKLGYIIDLGLMLPSTGSFFLEVKLQYRRIGTVEIGPFQTGAFGDFSTLSSTMVSYNHWFMGIGFGVGH